MIRIEPWGTGDRGLLEKCLGDPAIESAEKIAERPGR